MRCELFESYPRRNMVDSLLRGPSSGAGEKRPQLRPDMRVKKFGLEEKCAEHRYSFGIALIFSRSAASYATFCKLSASELLWARRASDGKLRAKMKNCRKMKPGYSRKRRSGRRPVCMPDIFLVTRKANLYGVASYLAYRVIRVQGKSGHSFGQTWAWKNSVWKRTMQSSVIHFAPR